MMSVFRKYLIICFIGLTSLFYTNRAQGQLFFIGLEGGATYSWFNSPGIDNIITSDGWGWNMGFFLRYGKKTYLQIGFDWTRSKNDFTVHIFDEQFSEEIKFHKFDFSLKYGYNFFYRPMFKFKAHAGPFIGRSFLISGNEFEFSSNDFKNPQWGLIGGLGFQFMNFVADIEYSYHFTDLFKPVVVQNQEFKFGSNLQLISIKVGFMF